MDWINFNPTALTDIFAVLYKMFGALCMLYGNIKILQMGYAKFQEVSAGGMMTQQQGDTLSLLKDALIIWSIQPLFYAFNTDFGFSSNPLRIFLPGSVVNIGAAGEILWYLFAGLTLMILVLFTRFIFDEGGLIKKIVVSGVTVIACQFLAFLFEQLK